ncbi:FAD/NAD(P)-binding domain-containing protein [Saccharata proteae CBS 121410]|uniref:FAD/NAD(P)-binding domain-containing protein n=1 Tax=Saccharata proteae CBS 121410 TaxID=1314787 RepID=A0A9P4M104_9PEZI|nr:FAD/NAD(P)-binding domain-containing protein [Saccharata proteae CBS 121410]
MSTSSDFRLSVKRVAVIGAGPSGLAAAKYLSAEKAFEKIVVFEQRSSPGGLWNYTPEGADDGSFSVPKTRPTKDDFERPVWRTKKQKEAQFISPIYERLETNIPKKLMRFSDLPFPETSQLFPTHPTVRAYLEEYAKEVQHLIRYQTQVLNVELLRSNEESGLLQETWNLKTKDVQTGVEVSEEFDAVMVASGHFYVPYVPDIPGLREWASVDSSSITHSKFFRIPDPFAHKKVTVVGNSASGLDIGSQIATVCQLPLLNSVKSESYLSFGPSPSKREVAPIQSIHVSDDRKVVFADGHVEQGIDAIVFCTGYLYSLPFLSSLSPPLITDGRRVENTYKHIFYAPHPSLSLLSLNQKIIPFPTAEVQSAVVARMYAGRLALPPHQQMKQWEAATLVENGDGTDFHTIPFPKDADYIVDCHDWAVSADDARHEDLDGKEKNGEVRTRLVGKRPPRWGEEEYWMRERFPAIRKAFTERGEDRKDIRELEELGFDFDAWKRERAAEEAALL